MSRNKSRRRTDSGELARAFGAAGKHQGARHVANAVKSLARAVQAFQRPREAIDGYEARPLLERLRKDIAVGERLLERRARPGVPGRASACERGGRTVGRGLGN
jgi:hypothetical protein